MSNGFYTPQFTVVDIFVIGNFQIKAPQVPNRKICHAAKFREVVTARSCDLKKSRFYCSDLLALIKMLLQNIPTKEAFYYQ